MSALEEADEATELAVLDLTDPQARALRLLDAHARTVGPTSYVKPWGVHELTLGRLAELELVEVDSRPNGKSARLARRGRTWLELNT